MSQFLVDPNNVIDFHRDDGALELFWLFSLVVAGKTAATQSRLLNGFLTSLPAATLDGPFGRLRLAIDQDILLTRLIESRLGQYHRLHQAFAQSVVLDLRGCGVADLEAIHGVGPKTARMFLMMSRPGQRYAALDTHVLKYLVSRGVDAPKATPPAGKRYRALEDRFLTFADESGMTVAEFDLTIWKQYSKAARA